MSGGPISFGSYNFPQPITQWRRNFGDGVPTTVRLPGLSGGFNEDGLAPAPTAIGQITVGYQLWAASASAMDDLRDAVWALASEGVAKLVYQPTDSAAATRYAWARVHYINMPERKDELTDLKQDVTVTFQVAYPFFYGGSYEGLGWDSGGAFNSGYDFGEGALKVSASGLSTTQALTNNGNAPSIPKFVISPPPIEYTADLCTGGTASASSTYLTNVAANAFDDNTATFWHSDGSPLPQWIEYQFSSAQIVRRITITAVDEPTLYARAPRDFQVQYYDGASWQTASSYTGVIFAGPLHTRYFAVAGSIAATRWRLYITATGFDAICQIAEIEMFAYSMSADQCTGGTASASSEFSVSYPASNAFDNTADFWASAAKGTQWLQYTFAEAKAIRGYAIKGQISISDRAPRDFEFQYYDGASWQTADSRSGITWSAGERKQFGVAGWHRATQWRLVITDSNSGVASYVIEEMEMFEQDPRWPFASNLKITNTVEHIPRAVKYADTLGPGDVLVIDGGKHKCTVNGVSGWHNLIYDTPQFMQLASGANSLDIEMGDPDDAADVYIYFSDVWR